jgi:hypothetical protein
MSNFYQMEEHAYQKSSNVIKSMLSRLNGIEGIEGNIINELAHILKIVDYPSDGFMVCPIGSELKTIYFQVKAILERYYPLSKLLEHTTPEGVLIWAVFWDTYPILEVVSAKIQQEQEKYNECAEGFRRQYTIEALKSKHQAFILALDKKTEQAAALNAAIELLRGVSDSQIFDNEIEVLEMAFYANQKHKLCLIEEKTTTKIIAKIAFNIEL